MNASIPKLFVAATQPIIKGKAPGIADKDREWTYQFHWRINSRVNKN